MELREILLKLGVARQNVNVYMKRRIPDYLIAESFFFKNKRLKKRWEEHKEWVKSQIND